MPPKRKQVEKDGGEDVKKAKTEGEAGADEATKKSKEGKGNLKIISWNVDGLRAWTKKGGLTILENEEPDMLCLQETKCSEPKLPPEVKEIKNYKKYFLSGDQEGYSGVALFSKKEPLSIKYGFDDKVHDKEGRVITAEYDGFYLVTSYVPNAGKKLVTLDKRMDWDPKFRSYLKDLDAKKPVILCGDLNVAHKEIDLKNPKTNKKNAGFTQEERDGFTDLLAEGFSDSYRHLYPDKTDQYTFWTYMMNARGKNVGWRLDYFVLSERILPKMSDNIILSKVMGSDHCPIELLIDL